MSAPPPELLRRLYATPPERFVAARDEAVAQARRAGDPATAREIAGLRRPTVAAWLVNLLAIHRPDLVAELTRLAGALREAQRDLRGATLRELSAQRRAVVGALVAEVRRLAAGTEGAPPAARLPLAEVESTLQAALADTGVAEQLRSGRLLRAAHYAGFGEVPRPQLRLLTGGAGETTSAEPARDHRKADAAERRKTGRTAGERGRAAARPAGAEPAAQAEQAAQAERRKRSDREAKAERAAQAERAKRRRALERELAKARTAQDRAEAELADATAAERDAADALAGIEAELAELERRRAGAEQEVGRRRLARRAAERAVTAARRHAGEVEGAVEAWTAESGAAGTGDDPAH